MKAASTELIFLPTNLAKRKTERREDGGGGVETGKSSSLTDIEATAPS